VATIPRSTFPACYFDALPDYPQTRSAFRSTTRHGCDPATGSFIAQTRCLTTARHPRLLLERPLPFGAFPPLGIKAFRPIRYRVSPPSESARSPFAPRRRFVLGFGYGSTFQARFVFGGLLLRFQLAASSARSAFRLCYPIRLAPVWAASLLLARCRFHSLLENRASSLHSPWGFFGPSGSKCSAGLAVFRPAFRILPISLRSPPPVSICQDLLLVPVTSVSAADHRSRSATSSEV